MKVANYNNPHELFARKGYASHGSRATPLSGGENGAVCNTSIISVGMQTFLIPLIMCELVRDLSMSQAIGEPSAEAG